MSDYDINIIVSGDDQASEPLQSVEKDLRGVGEAADSSSAKGGGFFSNLLSTAGGFLAANVLGSIAGQVKDFVGDGIADARKTAQLMAQTNQIITATGGAAGMSAQQVSDLATNLSDAAGKSLFGDDQIQGAENVLLKFKELKGIIPGVTQLSVDMAQSLGKDPADAAKTLALALQKPEDAAGKLAKMGIVLDDQQKAMIKTMVEGGDTAGAQKFLMDQLNGTYGGSALAAAGAAGGMVQFKAGLGEAGETIGAKLLPLLDKFGAWLASPVVQAALNELVTLLSDGIGTAVTWLSDVAIPSLMQAWTDMEPTVMQTIAFLQSDVMPVLAWIADVLIAGLKIELAALGWAWTNVLLPDIKTAWAFFKTYLLPVLSTIFVALRDDLPKGIAVAVQSWADFKLALASFKETYLDPIGRGFDVVVAGVTTAKKLFDDFLSGVAGAVMPSWLSSMIGGGIKIPGFADGVTNFGGGLAMVGERGPELLRLPGGSDVMPGPFSMSPLRPSGGSGSGGTTISVGQIVVQGNGDPAATARAVREELLKLQKRNLTLGFT